MLFLMILCLFLCLVNAFKYFQMLLCCLQATGGSGEYSWNSFNLSVATVNNKGYTSPVSLGISTVVAADVKNHRHTGMAKVWLQNRLFFFMQSV